jgi:hypothetical protein
MLSLGLTNACATKSVASCGAQAMFTSPRGTLMDSGCVIRDGLSLQMAMVMRIGRAAQIQPQFSEDSGGQNLQVRHVLGTESLAVPLIEQAVSGKRTASQRVDGCVADNNAQAVLPGP